MDKGNKNKLTKYTAIIWDKHQDYKKNNSSRFESICKLANAVAALNGTVDLDSNFCATYPPSRIIIHLNSRYENAIKELHCIQELARWD
jgi:hypothetical protein